MGEFYKQEADIATHLAELQKHQQEESQADTFVKNKKETFG